MSLVPPRGDTSTGRHSLSWCHPRKEPAREIAAGYKYNLASSLGQDGRHGSFTGTQTSLRRFNAHDTLFSAPRRSPDFVVIKRGTQSKLPSGFSYISSVQCGSEANFLYIFFYSLSIKYRYIIIPLSQSARSRCFIFLPSFPFILQDFHTFFIYNKAIRASFFYDFFTIYL